MPCNAGTSAEPPYVFNVPDIRALHEVEVMGFHRLLACKLSFSLDGLFIATEDDQGYLVVRYALNLGF